MILNLLKNWVKRFTYFDIGLMVLCVIFYVEVSGLESSTKLHTFSPRVFPISILLTLFVLTLFPFEKVKENRDGHWVSIRALIFIITLVLFAFGVVYLGLIISTVVGLIVWMILFGYRRYGVMILLAVGFSVVARYLFVDVFGIWFPGQLLF